MGIAVAGTLSAISTAMRNGARLMDRDRAVLLARTKMNELITDTSLRPNIGLRGEFGPLQSGGHEAGWQAGIAPFEQPLHPAPGDLALERIDLEVWWRAGNERRTYRIQAYRVRTLTPADFIANAGGTPQ